MTTTGEPEAIEHPAIGRYHDHVLGLYRLMADNFGKNLLLLSGGALALSIPNIDKIGGPTPVHREVLFVGWASLVACLALTLFSTQQSAESMLVAAAEYPFDRPSGELGGGHARAVIWLNRTACVTLVVGLGLLAFFAFVNPGGSSMSSSPLQPNAPIAPGKPGTTAVPGSPPRVPVATPPPQPPAPPPPPSTK